MNPESSDPLTPTISAQTLKESTIISFVFVRHAHQLISIYKMNYRTDIVFFLGGGGAQWEEALISKILLLGGELIREWALITSFTVQEAN